MGEQGKEDLEYKEKDTFGFPDFCHSASPRCHGCLPVCPDSLIKGRGDPSFILFSLTIYPAFRLDRNKRKQRNELCLSGRDLCENLAGAGKRLIAYGKELPESIHVFTGVDIERR